MATLKKIAGGTDGGRCNSYTAEERTGIQRRSESVIAICQKKRHK